jgi:hypothetical protein
MLILAWLLLIGSVSIILIRTVYFLYWRELWQQVCLKYICDTDLTEIDKHDEYARLIPAYLIIGTFWVWNFERFIANQNTKKMILDFYAARKVR